MMISFKAIHVTWILVQLMTDFDARYDLVDLDDANEGMPNKIIEPLKKVTGSIICDNLWKF